MAFTDPLDAARILRGPPAPGRTGSGVTTNRQHVTVRYGKQVGKTRTTGGARATQRSLGQRASGQKIPKASSGKPTKPTGAVKPAQAAQAAVSPAISPAQAAVNAQIDPQLLALNQQGTAYDTAAQQRQQAIQGLTLALIKQLQGNPAAIGGYYDSAINQTAGLANQSAQLLAAANPNAGVQADLSAIGAPAAQGQQVAQGLNNVFSGGAAALFGTRGVLPGTQLATDKAAAQTQALGETNVAAAQGQQNLGKALQEDELFRQNLSNQRAGVMAKEPGLLQDAQNQIDNANAADRKEAFNEWATTQRLGLSAASNKRAQAKDAFNEWATTQRIGMSAKSLNMRQAQNSFNNWAKAQGLKVRWADVGIANQRLAISASQGNARLGMQAQGLQIRWAQLGLSQQRITAQENKLKSGGFTPAQIQRYTGTAATIADGARHGVPATGRSAALPPITYNAAIKEMRKEGVPISIAVKELNRVYGVQYQVTPVGLVQTGITGQPGWQSTGRGKVPYIGQRARSLGLDPNAVLAVAAQEGLGGGVGDGGTSFGPFQMHIGGALPRAVASRGARYAQQWAWSQQGIDYALRAMAKVARGLTGQRAIDAIVRGFERPANPGRESASAAAAYGHVNG